MVSGVDHLVIAVPDLDTAASELERQVGLRATGGGRHEGMGTANRIAWLADGSYLELIAVEARAEAVRWPVGAASVEALESRGGGLACYALLEDDLGARVAELRAAGSSIGPAIAGSRRRMDGDLVEWWTAAPEHIGLPDGIPFLIRHAYAGAEWGPAAMRARADVAQPLPSPVVLARLDLAAADPPALAARYRQELGLDFWSVADLAVCTVGPHVIRLVRSREMEVPAAITLRAPIEVPEAIAAFGIRIAIEPVAATAPVEQRA
jgi:Glyoxalase-like domain